MVNPDHIDVLQDQLDKFSAVLVIGCLLFFVGGTLGIFASTDFASGTNFMIRLGGAEQALGVLAILTGWVKVRSIKAELARYVPLQTRQARAAGAGH